MAVVKIPESLREDLARMDLTFWQAMHPMDFAYEVNGQKGRGRHDKSRVMVQLNGPGLADYSPWGYGGNIHEAVQNALQHPEVIGRVPGLKGAMMRLELALRGLEQTVKWDRLIIEEGYEGAWEDYVPF